MNFCPKCGTELGNTSFCPACGFEKPAQPAQRQQAQPPVYYNQPMQQTAQKKDNSSALKAAAVIVIILAVIVLTALVLVLFRSKIPFMQRLIDGEERQTQYYSENYTAPDVNTTQPSESFDYSQQKNTEAEDFLPFSYVNASSTLHDIEDKGVVYNYSADNLTDGNGSTCWAEGVGGAGTGEKVTFSDPQARYVTGVRITNGYGKSEKLFNANNRVKTMKVVFDDGTSQHITLKDGYYNREQVFTFDTPKKTKVLEFVITDVYYGSDINDTCVSDIILF